MSRRLGVTPANTAFSAEYLAHALLATSWSSDEARKDKRDIFA
jgi:hypothetical protein